MDSKKNLTSKIYKFEKNQPILNITVFFNREERYGLSKDHKEYERTCWYYGSFDYLFDLYFENSFFAPFALFPCVLCG